MRLKISSAFSDEMSVERRQEARIQTEEEVQVTVLADPPGAQMTGRAVDLSGRGLSLILAQALPAGVAVRIDRRDRLLLGEVAYCVAEGGAFRLGIEVDQSLRQTRDLVALRCALQAEAGAKADATMKETPHEPRIYRPEAEAQDPSSSADLEHSPSYVRIR